MVRIPIMSEDDHLPGYTLVRRARLTFEALRGLYHHGGNHTDMCALSARMSRSLYQYRDLGMVGPIPGILVGDVFNYRVVHIVVGLHNQGGIGYVPVSEGCPIAIGIVFFDSYIHDHGNGDVLVYTGGDGACKRGEHHTDQAFERCLPEECMLHFSAGFVCVAVCQLELNTPSIFMYKATIKNIICSYTRPLTLIEAKLMVFALY